MRFNNTDSTLNHEAIIFKIVRCFQRSSFEKTFITPEKKYSPNLKVKLKEIKQVQGVSEQERNQTKELLILSNTEYI